LRGDACRARTLATTRRPGGSAESVRRRHRGPRGWSRRSARHGRGRQVNRNRPLPARSEDPHPEGSVADHRCRLFGRQIRFMFGQLAYDQPREGDAMTGTLPALSVEELRLAVDAGTIDTVALAIVDMQGRLQGKRLHAEFFLDEVIRHATEGCNYLLAVDVDMNTVDGYAMSSWERGYGDFVMAPDLSTLRRVPWRPGTAMLLADLAWLDGSPVAASPRQILRRQLDRLAEHGLAAYVGTELEFVVYRD